MQVGDYVICHDRASEQLGEDAVHQIQLKRHLPVELEHGVADAHLHVKKDHKQYEAYAAYDLTRIDYESREAI